jgi:hypothetical protein
MAMPYRARVNERTLLNLPGFHSGAFVYVYVEDTSLRTLQRDADCEADCDCCPQNFEPYMMLEVADCNDTIGLTFDIDTAAGRENSLHKLDTLMTALNLFRAALVEEFEPYDHRERQLEALIG